MVMPINAAAAPRLVAPGKVDAIERARDLSIGFAARAADHDRDASFPFENFTELHDAGLLSLTVPAALVALPFLIVVSSSLNEMPCVASTGYPHAGSVPRTRPVPRESSAAAKLSTCSASPRSVPPLQRTPFDVDCSIRS